jgi:NADPH:quinone reductase
MRVAVSNVVGGPETLVIEERSDPVAEPGKIVLRVEACGVNYPDVLMIQDKYQFKPQRPVARRGPRVLACGIDNALQPSN